MGSAKRKRQQQQQQQRKRQQQAQRHTTTAAPLLSPELAAELGVAWDGEAASSPDAAAAAAAAVVVVPAAKGGQKKRQQGQANARGQVVEDEALQDARALSKRQRKRLEQIAQRKRKEARRSSLYETLAQQRLLPGTQALLRSSKAFSMGRESTKARLARALERRRAGLPIDDPEAEELLLREIDGGADVGVVVEMEEERQEGAAAVMGMGKEEGGERRSGGKAEARRAAKARRRARKEEEAERERERERGGGEESEEEEGSESEMEEEQEMEEAVSASSGDGSSDSGGSSEGESEGADEAPSPPAAPAAPAAVLAAAAATTKADPPITAAVPAVQSEPPQPSTTAAAAAAAEAGGGGKEKEKEKEKKGSDPQPVATATTAEATAGGGKGLGAALFAQLGKLSAQQAEKEAQAKADAAAVRAQRAEAAASIRIPGLEGVDWLSLLDEMTGEEREAEEGEGGKRKEKYVPQEIPLLSPYAAAVAKQKAKMGGGGEGEGKREQGVLLPMRGRHVQVVRDPGIQAARLQLPVCGMEQEIVEAVTEHDVVVLCGETGSGKSTQVPQFLYEHGFTLPSQASSSSSSPQAQNTPPLLIGITQPRRVAAIATAARVAQELGTTCGAGLVGYQIRYDARTVTPQTAIKFMTDGILLQEISGDLLLRRYSAILLDEAHERNLNTDVLLGLLSRALPLRNQLAREEQARYDALPPAERASAPPPLRPLKLVIMSATLRVEDFTQNARLFPPPTPPPPVIRVEARQHPVTVHFARSTAMGAHEYLEQAYRKVCRIHRRLPPGGILLFLTGKAEIQHMCARLRRSLGPKAQRKQKQPSPSPPPSSLPDSGAGEEGVVREMDDEEEGAEAALAEAVAGGKDDYEELEKQEEEEEEEEKEESDLGDGEEEEEGQEEEEEAPVHVLPLFAMLTPQEQGRVFLPPPSERHRLIVVATNVAETSVTIPGIKYVVDTGRLKARAYDHQSGVSRYEVQWVSRASADQRAGRAGRTGPGHCYRLYSAAVYSQRLEQFAPPEVLSLPLEDVILQMRAMGIPAIERFPFPTEPDPRALQAAAALLSSLGATTPSTQALTPLGKAMAGLPLGARAAKMLLLGQGAASPALAGAGGMDLVVAMVAGLSERDPFVFPDARAEAGDKEEEEEEEEEEVEEEEVGLLRQKANALQLAKFRQWRHPASDALARLRAVGAFAYASSGAGGAGGGKGGQGQGQASFCKENMLHPPTMARTLDLRRQLARILNRRFERDPAFTPTRVVPGMLPPTLEQEVALRQLVLAGHLDNVARLAPRGTVTSGSRLQRECAYLGCTEGVGGEPLYIHPHSGLFAAQADRLPEFVCYQSIVRSAKGLAYMACVTAIEPEWLPPLALHTPLLRFDPPLASPSPVYDAATDRVLFYCPPRYGSRGWALRPFPLSASDLIRLARRDGGKQSGAAAEKEKEGVIRERECRWFARLLLEGKVLPELGVLYPTQQQNAQASLQKKGKKGPWDVSSDDEEEEEGEDGGGGSAAAATVFLNDPPALITHRRPVRKVFEVVQPLVDAGIASAQGLRRKWAEEGEVDFLRRGVRMWIRPERLGEFDALWRRVVGVSEVVAAGKGKKGKGKGTKGGRK